MQCAMRKNVGIFPGYSKATFSNIMRSNSSGNLGLMGETTIGSMWRDERENRADEAVEGGASLEAAIVSTTLIWEQITVKMRRPDKTKGVITHKVLQGP